MSRNVTTAGSTRCQVLLLLLLLLLLPGPGASAPPARGWGASARRPPILLFPFGAGGAASTPHRHRPGGPCGWTAPHLRLGQSLHHFFLPRLGWEHLDRNFRSAAGQPPTQSPTGAPAAHTSPVAHCSCPPVASQSTCAPAPCPRLVSASPPPAEDRGGEEGRVPAGRPGGARAQASSGAGPLGGGQGEEWGRGGGRERGREGERGRERERSLLCG